MAKNKLFMGNANQVAVALDRTAEACTLVDKLLTSRRAQQVFRAGVVTWLLGSSCLLAAASAPALTLSNAHALRIGKAIWQNECNGTIAGLTSWNAGENFASLGIGHFIWYPKGVRGPFEESFPKLVNFTATRGVVLPRLLLELGDAPCPWNSRSEFLAAQNTSEMKQLRRFLVDTVDLQAQFMVARLEQALPKMLEQASAARARIERNFNRVATIPLGCYALVDYVNFKGEGVLSTERYRGEGWGLLQVLDEMQDSASDHSALRDFARSAESVLRRRVENSPPERKEARWLPGWLKRISTYTKQ